MHLEWNTKSCNQIGRKHSLSFEATTFKKPEILKRKRKRKTEDTAEVRKARSNNKKIEKEKNFVSIVFLHQRNFTLKTISVLRRRWTHKREKEKKLWFIIFQFLFVRSEAKQIWCRARENITFHQHSFEENIKRFLKWALTQFRILQLCKAGSSRWGSTTSCSTRAPASSARTSHHRRFQFQVKTFSKILLKLEELRWLYFQKVLIG